MEPEPVTITVTKEVPADIPERLVEPCAEEEPLKHGSTFGDMLNHSNNRYKSRNECADKIDELRNWSEEDQAND